MMIEDFHGAETYAVSIGLEDEWLVDCPVWKNIQRHMDEDDAFEDIRISAFGPDLVREDHRLHHKIAEWEPQTGWVECDEYI